MRWPAYFSLSIRQKVVFGLAISLMAIVVTGGLSYRSLVKIEKKQHFVEIADDLSSNILEIRRYEKNFLLYGSRDDLLENRRYIAEGIDVLSRISPEINLLSVEPEVTRLEREFKNYADSMGRLAQCDRPSNAACSALEDRIRESGKQLVDLSHWIARLERDRILSIIASLKQHLITSLSIFLCMGGGLIYFVGAKVVRPLRTIEQTTKRIAQGNFSPLPLGQSLDETRRVMEAFNRMIAELERRQEQLVQAKKLSSIGILASGIAHQLNNPLNNLSTSLQIISEEFGTGDPDFQKRLLGNCGQEIQRAQEIVKGLLEFSRAKEFALRPTALREVVARAIRLISSQVPPGIEIRAEVPPDLVLALDAQRMQEVFLNLLMNAVQAIEPLPGEIRIVARVKASEDKTRLVEIAVEDSGRGIDQGDLNRIFDPFFTTKEVGEGTGLGLSIVYGIIQKHQGAIAVESQAGSGTRFLIQLPLKSPEARP